MVAPAYQMLTLRASVAQMQSPKSHPFKRNKQEINRRKMFLDLDLEKFELVKQMIF